MKLACLVMAGLLAAAPLALLPAPATAQIQLNVCGAPPLPPCGPRRGPPEYESRYDDDLGRVCRTRYERCRVSPRPIGSRCLCVNDDDEEVVGRVVR
ncbi:MAG: hypothetical protein JO048_12230 [Methylobacteriaceae bacterium]|nr:hypothetical protein [Methylobacteriaceae bacterium]